MKKLILALALLGCVAAQADERWRHEGYGGGANWVWPMVIGGVIGYEVNRHDEPRTVIIQQQQPVYVQPTPVLPQPPYGYHYTQIVDAQCNCYRTVLVPN